MGQIGDYIARKENELKKLVSTFKANKRTIDNKIYFANHLGNMRRYVFGLPDAMITIENLSPVAYQIEEGENMGEWIVNGNDPVAKILVESEEKYSLDKPFGAHDVVLELIGAMNERRMDEGTYNLILDGKLDLAARRVGIETNEAWLRYFENNRRVNERLKVS